MPNTPTSPNNYPDSETRVLLSKALQILEVFRGLDDEILIGEAASLLTIALGQSSDGAGLGVTDLKNRLDIALATAGRYSNSLATFDRNKGPGTELISNHRHPTDDRRKVLRLTAQGVRLLGRIENILREK